MAARVYNGVCLSDEQLDSLASIGVTLDSIVESSCGSETQNSCGKTPSELLSLYEPYDPQYGTPSPYEEGDRVVLIANDGTVLILYEALQDLSSPAGPFDENYWEEICRIKVQDGGDFLPTIDELESQYDYWDGDSVPYGANSVVLKYSACGDNTCAYVAKVSTSDPPPSSDWSKIYCVKNGRPDLCTGGKKCNGKVVYLSSPYSDQICVPVESTTGQRSDR